MSSPGDKPEANPFKNRGGSCIRWFVGVAAGVWLILAVTLTIIGFPPPWLREFSGLTIETTLQVFSFNLLAALIAPILLGVGMVILIILDIDFF